MYHAKIQVYSEVSELLVLHYYTEYCIETLFVANHQSVVLRPVLFENKKNLIGIIIKVFCSWVVLSETGCKKSRKARFWL